MPLIHKEQPNRKVNFAGDYPLAMPRIPQDALTRNPGFNDYQFQIDDWWFDFRTVLMRQMEEIEVSINEADNRLDVMDVDLDVVNDRLASIDSSITTISNQVTSIDNSITNINNQIITINHIVNTFVTNTATGSGIVQANGTGNPQTAITGSTGHFPYWQPAAPYLSATSPIYLSAGLIGIGTVGPATELDVVGVINASTGFRVANAAVAGTVLRSNGTNYIGGQVVLTTDVFGILPVANGGTNKASWTPGSVAFAGAGGLLLTEDNANLFYDDAQNRFGVGTNAPVTPLHIAKDANVLGSTFGNSQVKISGSTDLAKAMFIGMDTTVNKGFIASFSAAWVDLIINLPGGNVGIGIAAPIEKFEVGGVVSPRMSVKSNAINGDMGVLFQTSDLSRMGAVTYNHGVGNALEFRTSGTNAAATRAVLTTNLSIGLGAVAGSSRLHVNIDDAVATVTDVLRLNHSLNTGGTAANFGTGILLTGETSTTDAQDMARIQTIWTDSTHATRTSSLQFQTVISAAALATQMTLSGDGRLGFGSSQVLAVDASYFPLVLGANLSGAITLNNNLGGAGIASSVGVFQANLQLAGTGTFGSVRGISLIVNNAGTSTASNIRGVYSSVRLNAPTARASTMIAGSFSAMTDASTGGTISSMIAGEFSLEVQAAGVTATSAYGVRVINLTNTGTITSTYGVWVGDITTGTQTNTAYSFYANDPNAWNYFAGRVGINNSSPSYLLDVLHASAGGLVFRAVRSGTTRGISVTAEGVTLLASEDSLGAAAYHVNITGDLNRGSAGATQYGLLLNENINPVGGSTDIASLATTPLVNQTGGASGITRGLFVNATVTAAADFRTAELRVQDAVATVTDVLRLNHSLTSVGTAANFGTGILLTGKTSTTNAMDMARIQTIWTDSTHATRTSSLQFQTVNSAAALATRVWIEGNGNVGVGISPTTNFHVYSASGNVIQFIQGPTSGQETSLLFAGSGGNWKIGQQNTLFSGSLAFCLNSLGTPLVLFSRTGNVGIGMGANVPGALLDLGLAGTTLGVMRMAGSTSGNVTIQPQAIAGTWTLQLPQNDGGAGEFLRTDGGGITSWASVTPTYAFTEGSVIFAGAGGTSLAEDNANFFYDNAENQLRLGPSSGVPGPLVVFSSSIARTASTRNAQILSTDTSSTANISKSGIYQVTTGTWNGTNSTVYGIWNYAAGFANGTDGPTFLYGIRSEVEYGCDASYAGYFRNASNVLINDAVAVYAVSEPVACARDNYAGYFSATTNGTNLYGLRSSAVGGTTAYGLYCEATGATNNYGIFVNAGTTRIAAGTTTIAPLLFTSGVDLTTPTAGVMEYDGRFELTDVDAVRRHIVQAVNATKVTAGAPYANDGYVDMVINGTTLRVMTTA